MNRLIAFSAAVLTSAVVLAPANAKTPESVEVGYSDLDLRSEAGQARLDQRIDNAIEFVCDHRRNSSDRLFLRTARLCASETLANVTPIRDSIVDAHKRGKVEVLAELRIERPRRR